MKVNQIAKSHENKQNYENKPNLGKVKKILQNLKKRPLCFYRAFHSDLSAWDCGMLVKQLLNY